ncbi:hypothetical protein [Alkalinema sp. FACHB-956]|uniref:hypothetical protein n=1 Tax=Alkalinema sp. FACHB-956 TaxID=2692768 RepID=UPI001688F5D0|nr:hypothetical protein [Alkalinema sp. FACHB-956]MBD2328810.1 hypothetical protein [Alkalinema sp. FACHB-956]
MGLTRIDRLDVSSLAHPPVPNLYPKNRLPRTSHPPIPPSAFLLPPSPYGHCPQIRFISSTIPLIAPSPPRCKIAG